MMGVAPQQQAHPLRTLLSQLWAPAAPAKQGDESPREEMPVGSDSDPASSTSSRGETPETAEQPSGSRPARPYPVSETRPPDVRLQPAVPGKNPLRRNESAAAQLQDAASRGLMISEGAPALAGKRNHSSTALSDLRKLERSNPSSSAHPNRQVVIEAVVLQLHGLMLQAAGSGPAADPGGAEASARDGGAAAREAMHTYIETIVRQLELPNSCIVAMLIYVKRAVGDARFTLTVRNWQPCLLASFVVAAKLSFDEPVWNEDFVKALRISNVQTSQISRWEADFLQLIKFNTNVDLNQYTALCFSLQQSYEASHGTRVQFFTFLMMQAKDLDKSQTNAAEA